MTPEPEKPEQDEPEAEPSEQVFKVHGFIPDVSVYQVEIDMDKFCAGNDFAIFRARVNGKPDTKFAGWAAELKRRGFPFAVYDYLRLKSKEDAIAQADAMYETCAPYDPRFTISIPSSFADGVSYAEEREYIKVYVERLRERGVKLIGQYTGDYRWRTSYRDLEPTVERCVLGQERWCLHGMDAEKRSVYEQDSPASVHEQWLHQGRGRTWH